ncbi:SAM-dependent methyltransferase [Roseibium aggregatum]|uniref:SAM-dependent methyltransferase n=1 Tax=Roseibium aggregatum TaxID=187304 RepID=UPI001F313460|nr:class I SAM-dependent methyltransferase [Roseibium aggregatum]
MWDERYATDAYIFGTAPSQFLEKNAGLLTPGETALAVADGEGRNSVYLAEKGLAVTAMDSSAPGVEKARRLAEAKGVQVDFRLADLKTWSGHPRNTMSSRRSSSSSRRLSSGRRSSTASNAP